MPGLIFEITTPEFFQKDIELTAVTQHPMSSLRTGRHSRDSLGCHIVFRDEISCVTWSLVPSTAVGGYSHE